MSETPSTYTCDVCGYQAAERDLVVEHLRTAHGITDTAEVGSVAQHDGLLILRSGDSETVIDLAAWVREHLGKRRRSEVHSALLKIGATIDLLSDAEYAALDALRQALEVDL